MFLFDNLSVLFRYAVSDLTAEGFAVEVNVLDVTISLISPSRNKFPTTGEKLIAVYRLLQPL